MSIYIVSDNMLWAHTHEGKIFNANDEILIKKEAYTQPLDLEAENFYLVIRRTNYDHNNSKYKWMDSYYIVIDRLGDMESANKKIFVKDGKRNDLYYSAIESEFLLTALQDKEYTYDFSGYRFTYTYNNIDFDILKDKINYDSLATLDISELRYFIANIRNKDSDDVCALVDHIIDQAINSKATVNDMQIVYHVVRTYLFAIKDQERKAEKIWHFVQRIERKYTKKTKKLIRAMCEIFASSDVYSNKIDEEKDYYLLNEYFVHHAEMWAVKRIVLYNLEHIKDAKVIKNPGELLRYATEDERRRWYKHVNKTDALQPLANRIRETNYSNVDMVVDLIYCFVSGFTTEEFNKADLDIVADAIMDSFRYFFNPYYSLHAQEPMLRNKENMDILAKAIVQQLEQKTNIGARVKKITCSKKDSYFCKSIYDAMMESDNKKIKKALLEMAVE